MSRCRTQVRWACPNYVDHTPCWKRRTGCFCDRDMANFLVEVGQGYGDAQQRPAANQLPGFHGARERMKQRHKQRRWKVQKGLCHECPLFVEHQEYKYRHLSWISLPITGGIVAGAYAYFHLGYRYVTGALDGAMKQLAASGHLPIIFDPGQSTGLADNTTFEMIFLAALSLLLFSYIISLVDTMFLKWKL
jgi:hypothetical protein